MKRILTSLLASLLVTLNLSSADETKAVTGVIDLEQVSVSRVLPIYEKVSGLELVIDSRVKTLSFPINLKITGALPPKEEVLKRMREALLKQAGIVITRLDDKRESVTFNDALPINK